MGRCGPTSTAIWPSWAAIRRVRWPRPARTSGKQPDPSVFVDGMGSDETRHAAMRSTAGDRLLVYLSHPGTVSLRLDGITAANAGQATWVDPQTGTRTVIGQFPTPGKSSFSSPKGWSDAILLVEAKRDSGRTVSGKR